MIKEGILVEHGRAPSRQAGEQWTGRCVATVRTEGEAPGANSSGSSQSAWSVGRERRVPCYYCRGLSSVDSAGDGRGARSCGPVPSELGIVKCFSEHRQLKML